MYFIRLLKKNKAFTMLELMVAIAIVGILLTISLPNYMSYRNQGFCTRAETDANNVAAAVASYFSEAERVDIPTNADLGIVLENDVVISGTDPNVLVTIEVTDVSGRCPMDYQNSQPGWSNYVFTKRIE